VVQFEIAYSEQVTARSNHAPTQYTELLLVGRLQPQNEAPFLNMAFELPSLIYL
jgi:hypothetical protein